MTTVFLVCFVIAFLSVVKLISINYPEVLNIEKEDGTTPLHYATRNGREEIVEHILKVSARKKYNIDKLTKSKQTALHIACVEGYLSIVKLLLDHGATIDVESQNGNTAVHMCVIKHQLLFNLPQQLQEYELRPDLKTVSFLFPVDQDFLITRLIFGCFISILMLKAQTYYYLNKMITGAIGRKSKKVF